MKIKIVFHLETRWYYRKNVSSNGIFWLKQSQCQIKRSEKQIFCWRMMQRWQFFPRQTQMFLELLSFGTSLTLFITFNKTAQEFLFFFRVNHTKNLSNEGWTTWQWHVIDFFYHRSICLQDNYFRQFYQILTILHIKNLSRKEIIVQHTIVLP